MHKMRRKIFAILICPLLLVGLVSCGNTEKQEEISTGSSVVTENVEDGSDLSENSSKTTASGQEELEEETSMKLYFNDTEIPVTWENNETVNQLMAETESGDIVVNMSMYGGWEQVGSLGKSYPRNDAQMTAENGDIVLYSGNQIVVFYGENSWSYTKLGRMKLSEDEVTELLSNGNITLILKR